MKTGLIFSRAPGARCARAPQVEPLEGRRLMAATVAAVFNDPVGGGASPARTLTLRNTDADTLAVTDVSLAGPDAAMFRIVSEPAAGTSVSGGGTFQVKVEFTPPSGTSLGVKTATLRATTDASTPRIDLPLRALATAGETGANEPSLQRLLDLFEIDVDA